MKERQKQLITEIMNEDAKDGLYNTKNMKTAVQILIESIESTGIRMSEHNKKVALENEKQQIISAVNSKVVHREDGYYLVNLTSTGEQYYNETFKKE